MRIKANQVLTPDGCEIFVFMPLTHTHDSLSTRLFAPLIELIPSSEHRRLCHQIPDERWLRLGVHRCLMAQVKPSGRGFLQSLLSLAPDLCPRNSHFFESLKSQRRLDLCAELSTRLCAHGGKVLSDALGVFSALDEYEVHAADGHFHAHAVHDQADEKGIKHATGHLFMRNLRTGMLSHLTALDQVARKKEHDIRALKRSTIDALRQGAPRGRKVLIAYDRAVIDFRQWHQWKQGSGIYIITRCKENMALIKCGDLPFDCGDTINAGVLADELVGPGGSGVMMRRIRFHDVINARDFEFLTNVTDRRVPPGVLAFVYRLRWNIEKSFDEFKSKLGQTKAWATSATAKSMQAQFMCLSTNLLTLLEHQLQSAEAITNKPEEQRRAQRLEKAKRDAARQDAVLPGALFLVQGITQHTVKFIRWVAAHLWLDIPWKQACAVLAALYAKL